MASVLAVGAHVAAWIEAPGAMAETRSTSNASSSTLNDADGGTPGSLHAGCKVPSVPAYCVSPNVVMNVVQSPGRKLACPTTATMLPLPVMPASHNGRVAYTVERSAGDR